MPGEERKQTDLVFWRVMATLKSYLFEFGDLLLWEQDENTGWSFLGASGARAASWSSVGVCWGGGRGWGFGCGFSCWFGGGSFFLCLLLLDLLLLISLDVRKKNSQSINVFRFLVKKSFRSEDSCGELKSLVSCHNILSNGRLWLTQKWKISSRVYAIERKNLACLHKCSNFLHHCASRNVVFAFIGESKISLSRVLCRPTERRARFFAEQFFLALLPILCDFPPILCNNNISVCLVRFPWIARCVVLNVGWKLRAKNSFESTSSWKIFTCF